MIDQQITPETASIPQELRQLRQWVLWNPAKLPLQPNGEAAKAGKPETWHTFEDCQAARNDSLGIGFEFSADDPYVGIDLDDAVNDFGTLHLWAADIVDAFAATGAYIEWSPSGAGVHIITRATKPEGSRSNVRLEGGGGIECYADGRYFTVTGNTDWPVPAEIGDGQEALDMLVAAHLKPERPTVTPAPQPAVVSYDTGDGDLLRRAVAYCDTATLPPVGGRNQACFSLAGHLFSLRGKFGERLTLDEVTRLVETWAIQQGAQPTKPNEIRKACESAERNGTPRADKVADELPAAPDVDISALLASGARVDVIVPAAEVEDTEPITVDMQGEELKPLPEWVLNPPGTLGDIIRYQLETAFSPQLILAFAGGIALLATLYGRLVQFAQGTRSNLYVLALAPTASGKAHPRKCAQRILLASGCESLYGPETLSSGPGIITDLKNLTEPKRLYAKDEFDKLFARMSDPRNKSGPEATVKDVLLEFWEKSEGYYGGAAKADGRDFSMHSPHLCLFATCPADGFQAALTPESVTDGFLNRLLVFDNGENWPDEPDVIKPPTVPQAIVDDFEWWAKFEPGNGNLDRLRGHAATAPCEPSAAAMLKSHRKAIKDRYPSETPHRQAVWGRTGEKAAKLSLIHAASRQRQGVPTITVDDVKWGIAVANHCTRYMAAKTARFAVSSEYEADLNAMFEFVQSSRKGYRTLTDFARGRGVRKYRAKYRSELIAHLVQSKQVVAVRSETNGRSAIVVYMPEKAPAGSVLVSPREL